MRRDDPGPATPTGIAGVRADRKQLRMSVGPADTAPGSLPSAGDHNRALLAQCRALITRLEPEQMSAAPTGEPENTIGKHLRHILDHYGALISGLSAACIDYGDRRRRTRCERNPQAALVRLDELDLRLLALTSEQDAVQLLIHSDHGVHAVSTLARELEFVASHTTHHLAMIALLARVQGVQTSATLGLSVSTLRSRAES